MIYLGDNLGRCFVFNPITQDLTLLNFLQPEIRDVEVNHFGVFWMQTGEMASKQEKALAELQLIKLDQLKVKQQQQQLKLISDSIELVAQNNELQIAKRQIDAAKNMLDEGVISLVDFERSKVAYQNAFAKKMTAENKYAQSKQETLALQFEQRSILQDYNDKIAKVNGEKYSASADQAAGIGDLAKLENNYANYDVRNKLYYIIAPQSGQITKAKKAGIGEYVKEGEMIVEIVPKNIQYAVELFIEPMDLPLISKGQKVRFIFDGLFQWFPDRRYCCSRFHGQSLPFLWHRKPSKFYAHHCLDRLAQLVCSRTVWQSGLPQRVR